MIGNKIDVYYCLKAVIVNDVIASWVEMVLLCEEDVLIFSFAIVVIQMNIVIIQNTYRWDILMNNIEKTWISSLSIRKKWKYNLKGWAFDELLKRYAIFVNNVTLSKKLSKILYHKMKFKKESY